MHRTWNAAAGAAVASVWLLAGCSSLKSTLIKSDVVPEGLVYRLPTQELQVTLTVAEPPKPAEEAAKDDGKKPETAGTAAQEEAPTLIRVVTLEKTPPVADMASRYLLQYQRNHIGKNLLSVGIDENGLLSGESLGKTTPQLPELVKGIASAGRALSPRILSNACVDPGTYRWTFKAFDESKENMTKPGECGISITVTRPEGSEKGADEIATRCEGDRQNFCRVWKTGRSGYYYRQSIPVKVQIEDTIANITSIHYPSVVSSRSPTYFLPIPKALFAEVDWKVTFAQGMPTLYKVESGGDAIGLFQLPAEIVQAYADAVLGSFKREQSMDAGQAAYLSQLNALALAQARNEACKAAVATGEMEAIGKACQ